MFKIGTLADWFGVGLIEGIKQSKKCGAEGVQVYAWNDFSPTKVTKSDIAKVKQTAKEYSQEIVALCGELGGHGFENHLENNSKIEYISKVIDMGVELDCKIITTHIGVIPEDVDSDIYKSMIEACNKAGRYAKKQGSIIAIETGPEPVARLKAFVDSCDEGIAINYDPANLVMVTADDEVKGVYTGGSSIVHTHAKDGVQYKYTEPRKVYDLFAEGGVEAFDQISNLFKEMPLGKGNVRWKEYLTALKDIGYSGYLTIEREVGENATEDIKLAVDFLRELIPNI